MNATQGRQDAVFHKMNQNDTTHRNSTSCFLVFECFWSDSWEFFEVLSVGSLSRRDLASTFHWRSAFGWCQPHVVRARNSWTVRLSWGLENHQLHINCLHSDQHSKMKSGATSLRILEWSEFPHSLDGSFGCVWLRLLKSSPGPF